MPESRRHLLMTFLGAAGVLAAHPLVLAAQTATPRPVPAPNVQNPNFPHRLGDPPSATGPDPRLIAKQNRAEIKSDVQRLYDLASELKEEVEKTDATSTLSVSLVKKAQQIEKLAKQIKDRAKN